MSAPQSERLRAMIEQDIFSFRLKPGERLCEGRLAANYGTSRTPVREALRQLSSEGLIDLMPNKGAIVARLSVREFVEQLEVLAELEGACGRLAAKSCMAHDLKAIVEAQEASCRCATLGDGQAFLDADAAFHAAIYAASRNSCLMKLAVAASRRLSAYKRSHLDHFDWAKASLSEHEQIVHAIEEGLADDADRLLQLHTMNLGGDFRRIVFSVLASEVPAAI
jgi:DNA-binding GntR family transcriptional regulator